MQPPQVTAQTFIRLPYGDKAESYQLGRDGVVAEGTNFLFVRAMWPLSQQAIDSETPAVAKPNERVNVTLPAKDFGMQTDYEIIFISTTCFEKFSFNKQFLAFWPGTANGTQLSMVCLWLLHVLFLPFIFGYHCVNHLRKNTGNCQRKII